MPHKVIILDAADPRGRSLIEVAMQELQRRRRRLKRAPRMQYPHPLEREYTRELKALAQSLKAITVARVLPRLPEISRELDRTRPAPRRDAWGDDVYATIQGAKVEFARKYTDEEIRRLAEKTGRSVSYWNNRQLGKVFSRVLDLDVIQSERWLEGELASFTQRNVSLIKSIPDTYFADVETRLMNGFQQGTRWEEIAAELEARYEVPESKAALIARDQVGKLSGQLTELRQENLGLEYYRWRSSLDERVRGNPGGKYPKSRPSHWAREGIMFSWDAPPEGGHPGYPIQCRCYAEPVLDPDEAQQYDGKDPGVTE